MAFLQKKEIYIQKEKKNRRWRGGVVGVGAGGEGGGRFDWGKDKPHGNRVLC